MKNIVCNGKLILFDRPLVMAIINATPDSFYDKSRSNNTESVVKAAKKAIEDGADILDIGAYSTRPGADFVSEAEEIKRVRMAISAIKTINNEIPISVDTFRAEVARIAIEECGANIINDVSAGEWDEGMLAMVARLQVPYILMHSKGNPQTMQSMTDYDNFIPDILRFFARKINELRELGFDKEIIIDPGFGFAKTSEQNFELLDNLHILECFECSILVGISRKTMIWKNLGVTPSEALNGTTVLNAIALERGASILRVHDVKECKEAVVLHGLLHNKQ